MGIVAGGSLHPKVRPGTLVNPDQCKRSFIVNVDPKGRVFINHGSTLNPEYKTLNP